MELRDLRRQQFHVAARSQPANRESLGVAGDDVERLAPDAAGRTEHRDAPAAHVFTSRLFEITPIRNSAK
jgi:hypothetical protein